MPNARTVIDRFERLHRVTAAVVRLFAAGDWTPARGRAVEAALRALLLAWSGERAQEDDEAIAALLSTLDADDPFDPAVVVDRGPFVELLLSMRDRSMFRAAAREPGWRPGAWEAPDPAATVQPRDGESSDEQRLAGWLARALTRLYRANMTLDDHAIVSVTDRRGTIVEANEAFCRISGYAREELLGASHSILKSGRHPAAFYRELWSTIAAGGIWTGEICNRRKDGSYYWVRSTIVPVPGPTGEPEQYVSVRTEITAARHADERLALLEHAVLACSSGVVVADALRPELPISYASPSFARLFERDANELHDASLRELLARGQPAVTFDALESLLRSTEGGSLLLRAACAGAAMRVLDLRLSPVLHAGVVTHVVGVIGDVSELEATREALRDRDERLRRSESLAGFGTWELDVSTHALRWSPHIGTLFGLAPGRTETTYEEFLAAVHPHDRDCVVRAVEGCLELDKPYDLEHRCVWPDGTVRWVHEHGHVLRDERGRPARMLGVVHDVTERRRLAAELQHERERVARTQALAGLGDWRIDDANGEAWWSAALYRIYRRDPSSFRPGREAFVRAADPRDTGLLEAAIEAARNGRESDCLHRIALPDGERRWVRLRARPKSDEIGALVALEGTVQDVTEAMRSEDCARLLRRMLAIGENAVAIADSHGELVYTNRAWRRMLGYEPDRRPEGDLLASCEAPARETLLRAFQRRDPEFHHRGDLPMRRLDGTRFVARGEIAVSHDARGDVQHFVHQFRDADDELAHERALSDARAALEEAQETGIRRIARMAETLRGPSQSVLAFAQMLAAHGSLHGTALQYLHHVLDAGRRMLDVAGDALDLVRAEAGRLSFRIETVALDRVLADLASGAPGDPGAKLQVSIEPGTLPGLRCDPMRLVQALRALLEGASRASLAIGAPASTRDDANASSSGPIEIRITREGLNPGVHDAGLSLARLLLPRMDGSIEVSPQTPGERDGEHAATRGDTLVLRLPSAPIETGAAAPDAAGAGAAAASPAASQRRTVLHVDDDCTGLSLLPAFRDDARVRMLLSPSALLGIELARTKQPDAVLLDVDSAGVDAFSAVRTLRFDPRTRDIPVIALTADVSERNRQRIEGCGFFRFVEKPLSLPELRRTIDAALALTRAPR